MHAADDFSIQHLHAVPQHREAMAALIHHEFWTQVPGASVQSMAARLSEAHSPDQVPLCLVALRAGEPVGVVNLVDDDDNGGLPEWQPWLAGMVVRADCRGQGIGSALVRALLAEARRLGIPRLYFGTDGPGFYTRLGAVHQLQTRPDFWLMRFDLG